MGLQTRGWHWGDIRGLIRITGTDAIEDFGFGTKTGAEGIMFRRYPYVTSGGKHKTGIFINNYMPRVQPHTPEQVACWDVFKILSSIVNPNRDTFYPIWQPLAEGRHYFKAQWGNEFRGVNIPLVGVPPDWSKMLVSDGKLEPIFEITGVSYDNANGLLTVNFSPAIYQNGSLDDWIGLFVFVEETQQSWSFPPEVRPVGVIRQDGIIAQFIAPQLTGKTLYCYVYGYSPSISEKYIPLPPVWAYRKKVTFDNSGQGETFTDFPVLIHLTNANFDFNKAQDNGEDIRFKDHLLNELKYEIEKWDKPNQEAWIWVKVPTIPGSSNVDYIWMYYNNPVAVDTQDPPNVWDNNFKMVQHMYNDPDNQHIRGSTANHIVGTKTAPNQPVETTGQIGRAQDFNGDPDAIFTTLTSDYPLTTLEMYARHHITQPVNTGVLNKRWSATNMPVLLNVVVNTPEYRVLAHTSTGENPHITSAGCIINTLYYVVGVQRSNNLELYIDGVSQGVQPFTGTIDSNAEAWRIGCLGNLGACHPVSDYYFNGIVDEVRISNIVRTPDWITAQHLSMTDAFCTFGPEELL